MAAEHFRKDIQGLRTVAVLLVLLYHASVPLLSGGFVGVDVFFVISGFLITSHLLRSLRGGSFSFRDFYARRVRRLVPVALLVIASTLAASLALLSPLRAVTITRDAAASALYVPNIWFAYSGTDYLADTSPSPFQQYWSLGVEEQFYLIWPLLLFIAWRIWKSSRAVLIAVTLIFVVSLGCNIALTATFETWAFFSLPTRAWQFAVGGLIGLLISRRRWIAERSTVVLPALAWVGLITVIAAGFTLTEDVAYPGWAALIPTLGTAVLIFASADGDRYGPSRVLTTRVAQWLGDRSYSIYLWHWPLIIIPTAMFDSLPLVVTLALAAVSIGLADLSYRYVENPFRSARRLRKMPSGRFLLGSLAVAGVFAVAAVGTGMLSQDRVIASDQVAEPIADVDGVEFTGFVPSNGAPRLQNAALDVPGASEANCSPGRYSAEVIECEYGDPEGDTTYALFGDSHAAQWFPALESLAVQDGARLVVIIKASCTPVGVPAYKDGAIDDFCETWRTDAYESIKEEGVDRVFLAGLNRQQDASGVPVSSDVWAAGEVDAISELAPVDVTVIGDTPWFEEAPADCAAENLEDLAPCVRSREDAVDADWKAAEERAVTAVGADFVDPTDLYCSDVCAPYIGDTLVYRDGHHLTETFVVAKEEEIIELLEGPSR